MATRSSKQLPALFQGLKIPTKPKYIAVLECRDFFDGTEEDFVTSTSDGQGMFAGIRRGKMMN
jgi:hypothetical protein